MPPIDPDFEDLPIQFGLPQLDGKWYPQVNSHHFPSNSAQSSSHSYRLCGNCGSRNQIKSARFELHLLFKWVEMGPIRRICYQFQSSKYERNPNLLYITVIYRNIGSMKSSFIRQSKRWSSLVQHLSFPNHLTMAHFLWVIFFPHKKAGPSATPNNSFVWLVWIIWISKMGWAMAMVMNYPSKMVMIHSIYSILIIVKRSKTTTNQW